MHINCPHCHNPIEMVEDGRAEEVVCPSCGSSFRVEPETTSGWSPKDGGRKLGKFELIDNVGVGAFGTVYMARDTELERVVAIKVPRAGNLSTSEDLDRFLREARSVAQLRHPSIVPVHDVGQDNGVPYLVSDFVRGTTLADLLSARRPSPREAAELIAAVADALEYAHRQGVVHRDVKPSNIMLDEGGTGSSQGGTGVSPVLTPRLMDFGLAKRDAGEITMTLDGQVLGTPAYMSPEQAKGESNKVDGRSDVYSLGVVLYELLTGEIPFRGTKRMLIYQVVHEEPRSPRSLNDRIPRDLDTICLKAMAKEPDRRYSSAQALMEDLRRYLNGEPIKARPISRVERGSRWCKRNPLAAGLTVAVVISLLAGISSSAFYAIKANKRAKEASDNLQLVEEEQQRTELENEKVVGIGSAYMRMVLTDELMKVADDTTGHFRAIELLASSLAGEGDDYVGNVEIRRARVLRLLAEWKRRTLRRRAEATIAAMRKAVDFSPWGASQERDEVLGDNGEEEEQLARSTVEEAMELVSDCQEQFVDAGSPREEWVRHFEDFSRAGLLLTQVLTTIKPSPEKAEEGARLAENAVQQAVQGTEEFLRKGAPHITTADLHRTRTIESLVKIKLADMRQRYGRSDREKALHESEAIARVAVNHALAFLAECRKSFAEEDVPEEDRPRQLNELSWAGLLVTESLGQSNLSSDESEVAISLAKKATAEAAMLAQKFLDEGDDYVTTMDLGRARARRTMVDIQLSNRHVPRIATSLFRGVGKDGDDGTFGGETEYRGNLEAAVTTAKTAIRDAEAAIEGADDELRADFFADEDMPRYINDLLELRIMLDDANLMYFQILYAHKLAQMKLQ